MWKETGDFSICVILLIDLKIKRRECVRRFVTRTRYIFDGFVYHTNGTIEKQNIR